MISRKYKRIILEEEKKDPENEKKNCRKRWK